VLATAYDSAAEVSVLEGEVEAQPRAMEEVGDAPEPFLVSADEQALLSPEGLLHEPRELLEGDYE